ncbi:hypothetical protein TNCV_772601, partial [Trichonephila clavipes]
PFMDEKCRAKWPGRIRFVIPFTDGDPAENPGSGNAGTFHALFRLQGTLGGKGRAVFYLPAMHCA